MSPLNEISLGIQDPQTPNIVLFFSILRRVFISSTISFNASKILYIVIKSVWTVFLSLFFTFNYVLFTVKAILLQN